MELMIIENPRYKEYEDLLIERDQLLKEAESIWILYMQTFGRLITDIYAETIECIKRKKVIAFYQLMRNRGEMLDTLALQQYLQREMAQYNAHLEQMLREKQECDQAGKASPADVHQAKVIYRRLAKLLHPDMHPEQAEDPVLKDLWQRTLEAFARSDVKALIELEVLAHQALKHTAQAPPNLPDLDERIARLKEEIFRILHTAPYIYRELLEDPVKVMEKKRELEEELASFQKYKEELDAVIEKLMQEGGVPILWNMI